MDEPSFKYFATLQEAQSYAAPYGKDVTLVSKMFWDVGGQVFTTEAEALAAGFDAALPTCTRYFRDLYQVADANGGLFYYLYQGVKLGIYPPLIFMGVGAMTDFAPLIANPKSLLLGAAAQLGIYIALSWRACLALRRRRARPSASSAARTAPRPSSSPPNWPRTSWVRLRWRRIAIWRWCRLFSRPSCACLPPRKSAPLS